METFEHTLVLQKLKISLTQLNCKIFFILASRLAREIFFLLSIWFSFSCCHESTILATLRVSSNFHDSFLSTQFIFLLEINFFLQFLFEYFFSFCNLNAILSLRVQSRSTQWRLKIETRKCSKTAEENYSFETLFFYLWEEKLRAREQLLSVELIFGKLEKPLLTTGVSEFSRVTSSIFPIYWY